ncbi:MAG: phosphoribosylglycinamide formyltransferase [Erysipelotrichaceae bacterium]|nr:phosphoribosylglycinamide formyltransferase [Erysipelotrichaceae bacterium]
MKNVAVLVSGGGTNLQALIDAQNAGNIPHGQITLVVGSKPGIYALERAQNHNIDTAVIRRKDYDDASSFNLALVDLLKKNDIDVVVLAGYLSILGTEMIQAYEDRIINVHPSLIPSFCGMGFYGLKVHEEALKYGVKVTGATVHLVNEIADGGRILFQKAVEVEEGDTPEVLQRRVMEQAEWILLPKACELICRQLEEAENDN